MKSYLPSLRSLKIALGAVFAASIAVAALIGKCAYDRKLREIDADAMRVCADDVARRIRDSRQSIADITALYNSAAISKAKLFARMIATDETILTDYGRRFEEIARELDVDELHVSDARGVLIASLPGSSLGYEMYSRSQSAAFMPAITNRAFELVQDPMIKGVEYRLFQYAGVSRIDSPGIVQIGISPHRLHEARKIADINKIAETSRVGNGGEVRILPMEKSTVADAGSEESRYRMVVGHPDGGRIVTLDTDCDNVRILVTRPYRGWRLADDESFKALIWIGVILVELFFVIAVGILLMYGWKAFCSDFMLLFASKDSDRRRAFLGPVIMISAAVFVAGVAITWLVVNRSVLDNYHSLMDNGAEEFFADYNSAVDKCLMFVGNTICEHYPTPNSLTKADLKALLKMYNIDELNVVDENGRLVATTMAGGVIGQNQWERKGPREFCEKLLVVGVDSYSQPFRESASEPGIYRKYIGIPFKRAKGFIQIGLDEGKIKQDFDYSLNLADGWSLGTTGFYLLARNSGEIVSCGHKAWSEAHERGEVQTLAGIGFDASLIPGDDSGVRYFKAWLYGERCLCLSVRLSNYHRLIVAVPQREIGERCHGVVILVGAILLAVLGFVCYSGSRLLNLVHRLNEFIAADRLRQQEDAERRAKDLKMAREIQHEALPVVLPDDDVLRIAASMETAKEVGGDFYDFYRLPSGRMFFLVADTSGKGVPAAMFMMKAKAVIRACAFEYEDFAVAMYEANQRLSENNDANMFVTVWLGAVDLETGEVAYVNGGHNPPLIRRANGTVEWLRSRPGIAFGVCPGARYRVERMQLGRGDALFLYTDGVTEAMNRRGELYGEARLERALGGAAQADLIGAVSFGVSEFVDGAERSDDITMLSLELKTQLTARSSS